jgi:HEAT repeat protein
LLQDEDGVVRRKAAEALSKLKWKPENNIENVSYLLALQEWGKLIKFGEAAVEPLIAVLKDNDWWVQRDAAEALGKIGDTRAVDPLIANENNIENVSYLLALQEWEKLIKFGEAAVEPLIAVLKDKDSEIRENSAEALGEIGDARAVDPLIAALKDNDKDVRWHAASALGEIGDTRAVEPLIAALKDEDMDGK